MAETLVRVKLVQDTETLKVSLEVGVKSNVKAYLWCNGLVDADATNLEQQVDRRAQQCAEHQCRAYGDMHDPKDCGRKAVAALNDIQQRAMRANTRDTADTSTVDKAFGGSAREANGK